MTYYFTKETNYTFDEAIEKATLTLKEQGFGVLTEIDVQSTFKKKLEVDFAPYWILGACHPHFAYEALQAEPYIGTMLPCNVIVRQNRDTGKMEISAVDPTASMQAVENPKLAEVANQVRERLKLVIENV